MSAAIDKNAQALRALFGNDALAARLASTRLAVVTPPSHLPAAGRLLGAALVEVLARLWPNIDLQGHQAEILLDGACAAAKSATS